MFLKKSVKLQQLFAQMQAGGSTGSSGRLKKFSVGRTERWRGRARLQEGAEPCRRQQDAGARREAMLFCTSNRGGFRTAGLCKVLNESLVCHLFIKEKLIAPRCFRQQAALRSLLLRGAS